MSDIDARIDAIFEHERRRTAADREAKAMRTGEAMSKALDAVYARAERVHRDTTQPIEIKTFEC